jgi:alpha-1,6-mannosyltransferase
MVRHMRIAQLANFIGPSSGGMKTTVHALGTGYADAGVARLLVLPGPVDARTSTEHGEVVQLRAPRVGGGYRLILEPWRVIDVLDRFGPTSVEINDKTTLLPVSRWARRSGVASVLFSHERLDHMVALRTGRETSAKVSIALLNRLLVRQFDAIVVTSAFARNEFLTPAAAFGTPVVKVPLGVDLDTFRPLVSTSSAGSTDSPSGRLRLVHVGRLSREKSPHLAVATVVELHRRIAGADVALSVCPGETFGLAVLEALACGTPVVTASTGGASELIDAASGGWGEADPGSLADAVLRVAARDDGVRRAAARACAEQFPWSASVAAMLDLHRRLTRPEVALSS